MRLKDFLLHKNAKLLYKVLAYTATIGCSTICGLGGYITYELNSNLKIPTRVIENEKLNSDIILGHVKHFQPEAPWWKRWNSEDFSPQKALRKASSNAVRVRHEAVEEIATHVGWNDAEYQTIAQSLNPKALVGLARHPNSDLRLFRAPPALPPIDDEHDIEHMMRLVLTKLPTLKDEKCLQFYTSDALSHSEDYLRRKSNPTVTTWGQEDGNVVEALQVIQMLSLSAFVQHSKIKSQCMVMVDQGVLQVLQYISKFHPYNTEYDHLVQALLFRIVANICMFEEFHEAVIQSGWVTLLVPYTRSQELRSRMEALRALSNLDRDFGKNKFPDGVFQLYPQVRNRDQVNCDIVFLHGVLGSAFHTWRQHDDVLVDRTDCWPKDWLPEDVPGCRVLSINYDTSLTDWKSVCPHEPERRTIQFRAFKLLNKLQAAGLGDRPIIWVAHSMGGLIVKQMLKFAKERDCFEDIDERTKAAVFYGTPHFGSYIASYSTKVKSIIFPSVEVLEIIQNSPNLKVINDFLIKQVAASSLKVLSFGEIKPTPLALGINIHIVPPESAKPGTGEYVEANCDHFTLCKPLSRESFVYDKTVNFINQVAGDFTEEDIHRGCVEDDEGWCLIGDADEPPGFL